MREHRLAVTRSARVQTLGDEEGAQDVWVVVHGYGQLAADFLAPFRAIAGAERLVVAPEALNRFYRDREGGGSGSRSVGATWMTREDRESEIADYVAYLDRVAERFAGGRPVTALGFSQGVSTLLRWVTLGAAPVRRVIVWAGELPADVDLAAHRDRLGTEPVEVVLGSVDEYQTWINLDGVKGRLEAAGLAHRVRIFDGGHRLDRETLRSLADDA